MCFIVVYLHFLWKICEYIWPKNTIELSVDINLYRKHKNRHGTISNNSNRSNI